MGIWSPEDRRETRVLRKHQAARRRKRSAEATVDALSGTLARASQRASKHRDEHERTRKQMGDLFSR